MALFLLLLAVPAAVWGQSQSEGWFTLTNGSLWFFEGGEGDTITAADTAGSNGRLVIGRCKQQYLYRTGFDERGSYTVGINTLGTHGSHSATHTVAQGNYYIALDITDENNPIARAVPTSSFNRLCLWYRTGNTGLYYQTWTLSDGKTYEFYLIGESSPTPRVWVYKHEVGTAMEHRIPWSNWDYGAAVTETSWRNGEEEEEYYWMMVDTLNDADGTLASQPSVELSINSYQRPDAEKYYNFHEENGVNTWNVPPDKTYYDNVSIAGSLGGNYPRGIAATFMPVTVKDHPKEISELIFGGLSGCSTSLVSDMDVNDYGWGPDTTYYYYDLNGLTVAYGDEPFTATPIVGFGAGMTITPAYTEITEEIYRRGINLNYRNRGSEGWDKNGIAQTRKWYYYPDTNGVGDHGEITRYDIPPRTMMDYPNIDSVCLYVDAVGSRYFKINRIIGNDFRVELYDAPMKSAEAKFTGVVYFSNGTTVSEDYIVHVVRPNKQNETPKSRRAPAIKGLVCGGGKMANVTGDTKVTVHSADTIYAVYGGNDIAGWVQGANGAKVQIGTTQTNEKHPIHIGWVYGGGCGYYHYSGVYDVATGVWGGNDDKTENLGTTQLVFRGGVYDWDKPDSVVVAAGTFGYAPNANFNQDDGNNFVDNKLGGTLPYVKKATVVVGEPEVNEHYDAEGHDAHEHNDYIFIDSLFGGAENAFVGVYTPEGTTDFNQAITLDIHGGTILAAFGGNNYGGAVAERSLVDLTVHCTKLVEEADMVDNTYFRGYGKDWGIRHLFGGGNRVPSTHAKVTFKGGMVDTAFVGGNSASVANPIGIVECMRSTANPPQLYHGHNGHFIYSNPYMTDTTENGRGFQDPRLGPNMGQYNVRFLFGGNNLAPMDNVSFVQLHSGGVCSVYGGGNKGDMRGGKTWEENETYHGSYINGLPTLFATIKGTLQNSTLISVPEKMSSLIAANESSHIIADYIHGGCRNANVRNSCGVYLAGGNYFDVWGGNDVSGDVGSEQDGATYVMITGDAVVQNSVYGASDGYYHCEDPNNPGHYAEEKMSMDQFNPDEDYDPFNDFVGLLLPTQQYANVYMEGGLVKGDLVAGGVYANVGFSQDQTPLINRSGIKGDDDTMTTVVKQTGTVRLEMAGDAQVWGNVFGGGAYASIHGLSHVFVHGRPLVLGSLFAGNDCTGSVYSFLPYQSDLENDRNPYSYFRYYFDTLFPSVEVGGNTHADSVTYFNANPMTSPQIAAAEKWNHANQKASDGTLLNDPPSEENKPYSPHYASYVLIEDSPIINSVYGSGNGAWDYDGTRPQFPSTYVCTNLREADNRPSQESTLIDIHTSGGFIDTVFGGGAGSTVTKSVTVLLNNTALVNAHYPTADSIALIQDLSERLGRRFIGGTTRVDLDGTSFVGTNFVGTIFGGNNFDPMEIVPRINLVQGNVKNVYGGANQGDMIGSTTLDDENGEEVANVSSHVVVATDQVTVSDTVFGGCRMSNISGITFVEVKNTSESGIECLYGGNDISGNVANTRIDVSGGYINRIWGGSNGRYDFIPVGDGIYNVYPWERYNAGDPTQNLLVTAGRPDVATARVNLWGGTIRSSVFTGGSMADCNETFLVVDDRKGIGGNELTVLGSLYGGGEGRWDNLNARDYEGHRWGNINGSTHVDLYHAKDVRTAMAYGGGGGGDVNNTYITTYPDWDSKFLKIFGGCWGSDVHGTTHLTFNGKELVNELFGGNDFAGYVYSTNVVVNSGNFDYIYGGGNGEYLDSFYHSQYDYPLLSKYYGYMNASPDVYKDGDSLTRPNTEYVHITINAKKNSDVNVWGNVYGGGKVGTVLPLKKDASGDYVYVEDSHPELTQKMHRIPDTTRTLAQTVGDPRDFSYIAMNIHGGTYHNDIFGGGRGPGADLIREAREAAEAAATGTAEEISAAGNVAVARLKKPLVYGLKVVNMDGGNVYHSLYGGSEYVHDGYPAECKVPTGLGTGTAPTLEQQLAVTTMRPSSIVNIAGGQVGHNLYGAGYMSNVYGSVYVNLGAKAIDSSRVWKLRIGNDTDDSTYFVFKPGYPAKGSAAAPSDKLKVSELMMNESVFSGSNWGEGSGATELDVQGFFGGESRLIVDGEGYNTGNNDVATVPNMNIARSLLGSGTSVMGGDIHSQVELRNYGETDKCGTPVKSLESIQRTDSLWMHNSAVTLTGATDASSVYQSNKYTLNKIDDVCYRGYNVTEYTAPIHEVGSLAFYEQSGNGSVASHDGSPFLRSSNTSDPYKYAEVPLLDINDEINSTTSVCGDNVDICSQTFMVDPDVPEKRHSLLILDNGIDFSIKNTSGYGPVKGFAFIATPAGFSSLVSAQFKLATISSLTSTNGDDGGFVGTCADSNQTIALATSYSVINPPHAPGAADELLYTNHGSANNSGVPGSGSYRVWKIGKGQREREVTLLAHINPNKRPDDQPVTLKDANETIHDLAIAEAAFDLPSTEAGHYYTLKWQDGIELDGSNMMLYLVDSAWSPSLGTQNNENVNMTPRLKAVATDNIADHDPSQGSWKLPSGATDIQGVAKIEKQPESTFGLVMVPDKNFQLNANNDGFVMPAAQTAPANLVISGNQRATSSYQYCSPKVYNDPNDNLVTPSMRFYLTYSPTFMTTFNGTVTFTLNEFDAAGHDMGPIKVRVNIQTIIDSLVDINQEVLAMYNGGRTNEYTRKVVFPALGEERQLYIEEIRWLPTDGNGNDLSKAATIAAFSDTSRFSLVGDTNTLTQTLTGYPHDLALAENHTDHSSHNRFGLTFMTTNNVAEGSTQANGWGGSLDTINLYELAYPKPAENAENAENWGKTPVKVMGGEWDTTVTTPHTDSLGFYSLVDANNPKGVKLGTLDGRGSAGLDVQLNFDGTRMYDAVADKGYVGRAELHMKTYYEHDGTDSVRDDFVLTIYVKTREGGDTIYVASANSVTRQIAPNKSVTVYPYTDNTPAHNLYGHYDSDGNPTFAPSDIGKRPSLYVQSLVKALDNDIYQEGDVIAIIDEVDISNVVAISGTKTQHVVGPMGPPIEIIRYDGHHHDLPDEQSVYRGPMIKVYGDGLFTAQNIAFHGGAGARVKKVKRTANGTRPIPLDTIGYDTYNALLSGGKLQFVSRTAPSSITDVSLIPNGILDKYPDTNMAFGPIIEITDGGEVHLLEGTLVQHNWNGYGSVNDSVSGVYQRLNNGTGLTKHPELMGAVSITDGGKLKLKNNISIQYNFAHTMDGYELADYTYDDSLSVQNAPGNGNVYVAGGIVELADTKRETAVKIVDNYLMDPGVHNGTVSWFKEENMTINGVDIHERYILDPTKYSNWSKANVYLTRTPYASSGASNYQKMMYDDATDVILVSGTLGDETQLGVRKWFPGYQVRDTVRIARVTGGNNKVLETAVDNDAFVADDDFRVFYSSAVNNAHAYFFRCASFRHQDGNGHVEPVYEYVDDNTHAHDLDLADNSVLQFKATNNSCPRGGEAIVYSIQGGFMPYTYTWTDPAKAITFSEKETPYRNTQVQYDLGGGENGTAITEVADRVAKYAASMTDTLVLPFEEAPADRKWNHVLVTAVDATGECKLYKYIDLRIKMSDDLQPGQQVTYMDDNTWTRDANNDLVAGTGFTYSTPDTALTAVVTPPVEDHANWKTELANGWTDTSSKVKAIASRNFSGVKITPRVWVDRSVGTILAAREGDDYVYQWLTDSTAHELEGLRFCPGDLIYLKAEETVSDNKFIMWDFDPYYRSLAPYVVPGHDAVVTAYYGPKVYWHEHINSTAEADAIYDNHNVYQGNGGHSFVTTYNGDVHIYDEKGLAWLISCVNGFNGTQARSFRFNDVYIHDKAGGYDMKEHLWYPMGNEQHPFMGRIFGVGSDATATLPWERIAARLDTTYDATGDITGTADVWDTVRDSEGKPIMDTIWNSRVVIKNIILDERQMNNVGFFGWLDSAVVDNIALEGMLVHGAQYAGGLAAHARQTRIHNCAVQDTAETAVGTASLITAHYVSGGLLGEASKTYLNKSVSKAKYVGDAVYSGGLVGYGFADTIVNSKVYNLSRMNGNYVGGFIGYISGITDNSNNPVPSGLFRRHRSKGTAEPSIISNNYVHIVSEGSTNRIGGIVGYAEHTRLENNYAYGTFEGGSTASGVGCVLMDGVTAENNYYDSSSAPSAFGMVRGANVGVNTTFSGSGNNVQLSEPNYGTTNLTRALNKWVREHGSGYLTWRSDLEGSNNGYPIFGRPDIVSVFVNKTFEGCGEVELDGVTYFSNANFTITVTDSVEMVDSTTNISIIVHQPARTNLTDSADIMYGYEGYGFTVTPAEAQLLAATIQAEGSARLVLTDTLQTQYGCDSIVTLMLILTGNVQGIENVEVGRVDMKVYPNPTQDEVTIEADGMSRVEIYDNEGRRLADYTVQGDIFRLSMARYSSGMYYLRVHTPRGVTIQKVVKR